ncbi:DUF3604 domain-containing protein [Candidatus Litorirhabdus singularis]|nr:DUF3604 domain-containing protein [Candidatus Litorirhabdus singularis]
MIFLLWRRCFIVLLLTSLSVSAYGEDCSHYDPLRQAFFGDTHVHTRYSLDASTQGTRTTPDQAYRFARGERIGLQPWTSDGKARRSLQLSRPLDFTMLSDHAELIGEVNICNSPELEGYDAWECLVYRHWSRGAFYLFNAYASYTNDRLPFCGDKTTGICAQALQPPWREIQQAAEDHYDRSSDCSFTTFVGYEWTGMGPSGGNWHRNVMFRNSEVPAVPPSFINEPAPELLWAALERDCNGSGSGCEALTIPHNSNVSLGDMFTREDAGGAPIDAAYASLRQKYEPLVEIMQHKGSSECYFKFGETSDELCGFEQLRSGRLGPAGAPPMRSAGFVRDVLTNGLAIERELGVNPYKYGVIASTDTHLGTPGAAVEDDFLGHGGAGVPAGDRMPPGLPDKLDYSPGGLAVVWAEQNDRDSLFDAMQRRETYGTSGPRIITRFFGGWSYPEDICQSSEFVTRGYADGVPMGGDLPPRSAASPVFAVSAQADAGVAGAEGMPLQRIQIIKGWLDSGGQPREQVYDVVGSANNGASVDTTSCATSGTGHATLCAVWSDPDFDADADAWYYSRVIENPSCRWSQRICVANGVDCGDPRTIGHGLEECCAADHRPVIQERAWSSPIWYRASNGQKLLVNEGS